MLKMIKKLNKSQRKKLYLLIILLLGLPILVLAAQTIQDIRNRAAGTNEVGLRFSPLSGVFRPNDQLEVKVTMHKLVGRTIIVSGAQAVFNVGDKFLIRSATCLSPFDGLPFVRITGSTVTVFCAIATGTTPIVVTTSDLPFASVALIVNPVATEGQTTLDFTSTRVTEAGIAGQAPDVSTAGTSATYTIVIPSACPRGDQGNLDCSSDGCIDTADFELFRQAFGKSVSEIAVPFGQHTPDLVQDSLDLIDTADYEILRASFGTCGTQ